MKRIASIVVCIALLVSVFAVSSVATQAQSDHEEFSLSAVEFAQQVKAGWNLGNTMEATGIWGRDWSDSFTVNDVETGWGNPTTTQAMFDKVAEQGFNAVRIPVSWYRWVDDSNNYKIDPLWMSRVKTIVSYAYKHNMYVVVNMHHDDADWLNIAQTGSAWEAAKVKYKAIWEQIAAEFKDYDEHLVLEGINEPIARKCATVAADDWYGQESYYFSNINELYQIFVDTVRASGGNNAKRYLMIPTYGAQRLQYQIDYVKIPNNDNHIIIDIHRYDGSTSVSAFDSWMKYINTKLVSNGIGVWLGETGINYTTTDEKKVGWSSAFYSTARKYGLPVFIWDDGGDLKVMNRRTLQWVSQAMVDNIIYMATAETPTMPSTLPTTTAAPTSSLVTPDNNGRFKASSTVYYAWSSKWYHKTEGWQTGASNLGDVNPKVTGGICTWDLDGFLSQQLNTNWKMNNLSSARNAMNAAKNGSGYLIFTVTIHSLKDSAGKDASGVSIKHNITGAPTVEKSIFVNNGESKDILVDVSAMTDVPETFTLYFQQFEEGMSEIVMTISSITVAVPSDSTTAPTTTIKPTTGLPIQTTAPTTSANKIGDATGDGKIDALDLLMIKKYIVNIPSGITPAGLVAADVNKDGKVNALDLLMVKKAIVGLIKL